MPAGEETGTASGQLKRILLRRPVIDEDAEFELLQTRVRRRLLESTTGETPAESDVVLALDEPGVVEVDDVDGTAVGIMAPPGAEAWNEPVAVMAEPDEMTVEPARVSARAGRTDDADVAAEAAPVASTAVEPPPIADASPQAGPATTVTLAVDVATPRKRPASPRAPGTAPRRDPTPGPTARPAHAGASPTRAAAGPGPAPYCPYCALLLDPPPDGSRRCPRCKERIVVKHVAGRAVYITEAALAVFEAERRRVANSGRWTRDRSRWLNAAAAAGAPPEKIARLERAALSDEVVGSARSLYFTTVDRAYRSAKRERRWEDASRIMRDHAMVLFKVAGSPIPPPEESLEAHRLGATAALRGLDEMSRIAELVSGRCCDMCRADDGGLFKISVELRQPRLPHAGCPKGLCRCDWFLAVRDQSQVRRHLRRRARTELAVRGSI